MKNFSAFSLFFMMLLCFGLGFILTGDSVLADMGGGVADPGIVQTESVEAGGFLMAATAAGNATIKGVASNADLTNLTIPSTVTSIMDQAFYGCSKISSVTIPSSVTSIGSNAFAGCTSLTKVELSATNLTNINSAAFGNSSTYPIKNTSFYLYVKSGATDPNSRISYWRGLLTYSYTVTIPGSGAPPFDPIDPYFSQIPPGYNYGGSTTTVTEVRLKYF